MEKQDLQNMTDEELLTRKKQLKQSKIFHAIYIGFLIGILMFGFISWGLSEEKQPGFLIPMLIPVGFIYRMFKGSKKNRDLENVLKERKLD